MDDKRTYSTGAVRDTRKGKGRYDLLPLTAIANVFYQDDCEGVSQALWFINVFMRAGKETSKYLPRAINHLISYFNYKIGTPETPIEEWVDRLAKHFEGGCDKYGERNWELGIPCTHYIDSALRHLFAFLGGKDDEDHATACIWNLVCCYWTYENHRDKPEIADIPVTGEVSDNE